MPPQRNQEQYKTSLSDITITHRSINLNSKQYASFSVNKRAE